MRPFKILPALFVILSGCAKAPEHFPFANGACTKQPCGAGMDYGPGSGTGNVAGDAGADAADASDAHD